MKKLGEVKAEFWLILIVVFAVLLRYNYFIGLNLNDDLCYVNLAHEVVEGRFRFNGWIFAVRHMMHYPIAFFFWIFGVSDFSASLYILLCSLGGILVAFYIGKTLFNEKVALLAAFFMSFFPVDVVYSTTLVPDIPVAFFMGLSVCLFLYGERYGNSIYYYLSGVSIGLAWLVKGLALLILLFFPTYFLLDRVFNFRFIVSGKETPEDEPLHGISNKIWRFLVFSFIVFVFLGILLFPYTLSFIKPPGTGLSGGDKMKARNPAITHNGTVLYGAGIVRLYSFRLDKDIYWDIESNLYTNKRSRGYNGIVEDLEYSLYGGRRLHSLSEDVDRIAEVNGSFKDIKCSDVDYTGSYASTNPSNVVCVRTIEGSYAKLRIIKGSDEYVEMSYELEK